MRKRPQTKRQIELWQFIFRCPEGMHSDSTGQICIGLNQFLQARRAMSYVHYHTKLELYSELKWQLVKLMESWRYVITRAEFEN